jgi:hypothetical protein
VDPFETVDDARTRSKYIQGVLKAGGAVFGTRYHFLKGIALLGASGKVKPSNAKTYEPKPSRRSLHWALGKNR